MPIEKGAWKANMVSLCFVEASVMKDVLVLHVGLEQASA